MKVNSLTIVGGGTAGFITALTLKKRLPISITMVIPSRIGIIGVGEGSTEHFQDFREHLGIPAETFLKETCGTLKSGIMFKDWNSDHPLYLHHIQSQWQQMLGLSHRNYEYLMSSKRESIAFVPKCFFENKLEPDLGTTGDLVQYHFNTFKLNEYLTKLAKEAGIKIVDDEITKVNIDKKITSIKGKKQKYKSDFYIDCTGFRKILIGQLGAKWVSYSPWLKTNSAIAFPTEDQDEYNIWTLSKAMKAGWMWQIPTYGRTGNGYVFDKNYISKDEAVKEVEELLGRKIQVAKHIEYDPGRLDKVWIENCVAVGLSANFVEPLEATSIGTTIQQSFLLMQYLEDYTSTSINTYNKHIEIIMNNIKDFIQLHYITDKDDSPFWKDVKKVKPSKTLQQMLDVWKQGKLLKSTDLELIGSYSWFSLFKEANFNLIAYFNNLIDLKKLKENYEYINKKLDDYWFEKNIENGIILRNKTELIRKMSHKEYIKNLHVKN